MLYMEHAIRINTKRKEIEKWFTTGGIYTSCHDLISRILQFDVDGDMLNLCCEPWMIEPAKRTIKQYDIVPLFYTAIKAGNEIVSLANMFHGLKRAHENSGIGQISNDLTKLWNQSGTPAITEAGWITYMNNRVNTIAPVIGNYYRKAE